MAASALLAWPAASGAAEVVVTERTGVPGQLVVEQGKSIPFALDVSAEGPMNCATSPDSGVSATVDTAFSIGSNGEVTRSTPSAPLRFYAGPFSRLLLDCEVRWDGHPAPYEVRATVTTAPDTPGGVYRLPVPAATRNPSFLAGELRDDNQAEVSVVVKAPLPPPRENRTVNLLPISGTTAYSPNGDSVLLSEPTQVPVGTRVDATHGHVLLVSDSDGAATPQEGEFFDGSFRVGYTRNELGARSRTAGRPYTELRLLDRDLHCRRGRGATAARHVRRRLWGRVRGRYRTRSRYGAATVRGTQFLTDVSCRGMKVTVVEGRVSVFDNAMRRAFNVRAGRSYLAAPRRSANNRG